MTAFLLCPLDSVCVSAVKLGVTWLLIIYDDFHSYNTIIKFSYILYIYGLQLFLVLITLTCPALQ